MCMKNITINLTNKIAKNFLNFKDQGNKKRVSIPNLYINFLNNSKSINSIKINKHSPYAYFD